MHDVVTRDAGGEEAEDLTREQAAETADRQPANPKEVNGDTRDLDNSPAIPPSNQVDLVAPARQLCLRDCNRDGTAKRSIRKM